MKDKSTWIAIASFIIFILIIAAVGVTYYFSQGPGGSESSGE